MIKQKKVPFFARKRVLFLFLSYFAAMREDVTSPFSLLLPRRFLYVKRLEKRGENVFPSFLQKPPGARINRGIVAVPVSGMFFATSVCFALCFSTDNKRLFFGFVLLIFPLLRHFFYAVFYRLLFFANEFTNGVGIYGEKQSRATTEREPQTKTFFRFFLRVALQRLFCRKASQRLPRITREFEADLYALGNRMCPFSHIIRVFCK